MPVTNPTTNPLPLGIAVNVGLTNQLVMPPVQTAGGIIFHNPSSTVAIAICPATQIVIAAGTLAAQANVTTLPNPTAGVGAPAQGVAVINGAGSVTLQPGDKFIVDNLSATSAWNGIAGAAGGVLTILVY